MRYRCEGLPLSAGALSLFLMAGSSSDRIEKALARIEAAAAARAFTTAKLVRRHTLLRERIEDAVTSLDALIAREGKGE